MGRFSVEYHPGLRRDLRAIRRSGRRDIVARTLRAVREMEEDPLTPRPGFDVKPLTGFAEGMHRLRLGDYRLLFLVDPRKKTVTLIRLFHRGEDYRR